MGSPPPPAFPPHLHSISFVCPVRFPVVLSANQLPPCSLCFLQSSPLHLCLSTSLHLCLIASLVQFVFKSSLRQVMCFLPVVSRVHHLYFRSDNVATVLPDIVRETSKRAYENKPKTSNFSVRGKKKKKKREREIITLCTHTNINLNPEISSYLLLFLYVMILFCFSSRTSKQYDMQYNRKRNTLTTSPKTRNPRLPIFISDSTEKQAQSRL